MAGPGNGARLDINARGPNGLNVLNAGIMPIMRDENMRIHIPRTSNWKKKRNYLLRFFCLL